MVIKWKYIAISVLIIAVSVFAFRWFYAVETEEDIIRRKMDEFVENIAKHKGAGIASNVLSSNKLADYFTNPCDIGIGISEISGVFGTEQIVNTAMRIRAMFKTISLKISDVTIIYNPKNERAVVEFSATFDGIFDNGENINGVRDLRCFLLKQDGQWKINIVNIRQVLEK